MLNPTGSPSPGHTGAATAWLLLSVAALCWAGNFVLGRAVHAEIPPVTLAFWRWTVAALILLPIAGHHAWQHRAALLSRWPLILALAATGVCMFHVFVYTALRTTTATNAALILAVTPVVIPLMSFALYRTPVTGRQIAGIALSLAGVGVIVSKGDPAMIADLKLVRGDAWMLLAVPTWALYSVLLRHVPAAWPRLGTILVIAVCGIVMLGPVYVWELATAGGMALTFGNLVAVAYVAVFASVIAYICWNRGVAVVGANKAGLSMHLMPVFAAILAVILLGEHLRLYHAAGVALIGIGIGLTATDRRWPLKPSGNTHS